MEKKLSKNWVECALNELALVQSGGTPSRGNKAYWNGNIPWIKISDIKDLYVDEATEYITEEGLANSAARLFPKGTILFTIFATIGRIGILNIEATTNQAIAGITPSNLINHKYLTYSLIDLSNSLQEQGKGVAQKNINQAILKSTLIPLPPLAEQNRIVAKLDALFDQLETIKASMAKVPLLLKDFRQQVLTQAVSGKLKPFEKFEVVKLNDLGIWKGGGTPSKANSSFWENGTILWTTAKDMKDLFLSDSMDKITESAIKGSSAILIPKNSILIVTRSGILRRILPISSNTVETTVNQDLKVLIPNNKANYKFLLYALRGLEQDIRTTCMKSGTTVESVEFPLLKNYKINLPSIEEQQEIVSRVESLFAKADAIEKQYETLKAKIERLPQAILHKAFKGELTEQLDSDGDARELLREIEGLKAMNGKRLKSKKTKSVAKKV